MATRYRVSREELARGMKVEKKEHPWASDRTAKAIARDHLQRESPNYYRTQPVHDKIMKAKDKQQGVKPIPRKKPQPRPVVFFF